MKEFTTIDFGDALAVLIGIFKVAPTIGQPVSYRDLEEKASACGYMVHPSCSNEYVKKFVRAMQFNPNSTFYRLWSDVESKNRIELFINQIYHYMTTYGTDFQGEAWVPNSAPITIPYNTYFKILPVTPQEFHDRCMEYLKSPVALDDKSVSAFIEYLVWYQNEYNIIIDLDSIANRDVLAGLCIRLNTMPDNPDLIIKVMSYMAFGTPMLIKSPKNLKKLYMKRSAGNIPVLSFTEHQIEALARVFYRHKKFILGFKTRENAKTINRIRTLAKTFHRPMVPGFWEGFTNWPVSYIQEHIDSEISRLDNNFKIVRLMKMIMSRQKENQNLTCRLFHIRNGSVWTDKDNIASYDPYWNAVLGKLRSRLVDNLKQIRLRNQESLHVVHSYIKMPDTVTLSCPTSERKFAGNLPDGSYIDLPTTGCMFGIYWRDEWGTEDYDLHYMDNEGQSYGWNQKYFDDNHSVVFSGDMTRAPEGASEIMYIKDRPGNGTVWVARYRGEPGSKVRIFFADAAKLDDIGRPMADPNLIRFTYDIYPEKDLVMAARISDNHAWFTNLELLDRNIPLRDKVIENALESKLICIPLKDILLEAGYEIWSDDKLDPDNNIKGPAVDLTVPSKDIILSLFR